MMTTEPRNFETHIIFCEYLCFFCVFVIRPKINHELLKYRCPVSINTELGMFALAKQVFLYKLEIWVKMD